MIRDHSIIFEFAPKYCISDSFVAYEGYCISYKVFLTTEVDIIVIWILFTYSIHFSSLIPKMSKFNLVISCLTTSNLPWFVDLISHVSMQYCSLQHQASLSLFTFLHWRSKWQPTPVFLPGESQGRGSLVGCRLWGRTELDMTEAT